MTANNNNIIHVTAGNAEIQKDLHILKIYKNVCQLDFRYFS